MANRPTRGEQFITGIDDSGGHATLFQVDGTRVESPNQPFVGVAAVSLRTGLLADFEGRWNDLRARAESDLGLATLPPIHIRYMWGKNRPDKHKNPFASASQEQIAEWLSEASLILERFQKYRFEFGILTEFYQREQMQDGLEPFYSDPAWEIERRFLMSRLVPKGLYHAFHRATMYPLLRILPIIFWKLNDSVRNIGGGGTSLVIDGFTGTDGVGAADVLKSTRELAGLSLIGEMAVVSSYADSPLVQAADLIAWSYNRVITQEAKGIKDEPFFRVFGPILAAGRSLGGSRIGSQPSAPPETGAKTLCIAYSLARTAAAAKDPDFVETVLVDVDEFHHRALKGLEGGVTRGASALTAEGRRMAEEYAAHKMTGPRSETAAE